MSQFTQTAILSMAEYIRELIVLELRITMSWGLHKLIAKEYSGMRSLEFSVNGFLHKGRVVVAYNEGSDLFEVFLLTYEGNVLRHFIEIYVEDLIPLLDMYIEKGKDEKRYQQNLTNFFAK